MVQTVPLLLYLICGAIFLASLLLQVYLSGRESRWPGLVLPIGAFALSLASALWGVLLSAQGPAGSWDVGEALLGGGMVFLAANVPTVLYLGIYWLRRRRFRRREQRKRMDIQDLG